MSNQKKGGGATVIFVLISLIVIVALASFIATKYRLINQTEVKIKAEQSNIDTEHQEIQIDNYKAPYYQIGSKKIIALNENATIKDLIKNFKYCSIQAGMPIEVSQTDAGLFELKQKSPLKIHEDTNSLLDIGDRILGSGFLANGDEVGKTKILQVLKQNNSITDVKYTVVPVINCIQ